MAMPARAGDPLGRPPLDPPFRWARKEDARAVAELVAIAGAGIPTYLWEKAARRGQSALDVGTARAARDDASFSYRYAVLADAAGTRAVGLLLGSVLTERTAQDRTALATVPALLRPMIELEHAAPGTWYVNALAVRAPHRGGGLGTRFLGLARALARTAGCDTVSVQVFAQNTRALRLYERCGFRTVARRPIVAHPCYPYDGEVLLLTRPA